MIDSIHADFWSVIVLFCEIFSHQLLTMGDDEFFSPSAPLSVDKVIKLSAGLKIVAFQMHWLPEPPNTFICGTMISFSSAVDLFTRILAQIFDRDTRRSFCPNDHWIIVDEVINDYLEQVPSQSDLESAVGKVRACQNILRYIPFIVPFEKRIQLFRKYINYDIQESHGHADWYRPVANVSIRRGHVFEDGYASLNALSTILSKI